MTSKQVCGWCEQLVREVCEHPACVRAYLRGFCTVHCEQNHDQQQAFLEVSNG
jgi:hypothetical protein